MSELADRVRELANEIHDPCSLAQGVPIGLADMGLVTAIDERDDPTGGTNVTVTLRLTAPACMYGTLFAERLREQIGSLAGVASVEVELGDTWTWTPDAIAPAARERLVARRRRLLERAP